MKSPSDINDKNLNVIVSLCLLKLKYGYGNYTKLLLVELQIKSFKNINKQTTAIIQTSLANGKYIEIINKNIKITVRVVTTSAIKVKTSQQSRSEIISFLKTSSLIMLHRLPGYCQHSKQEQQHKLQNIIPQQQQQAQVRCLHCYHQQIHEHNQLLSTKKNHQGRKNNNTTLTTSNIIQTDGETISSISTSIAITSTEKTTPTITTDSNLNRRYYKHRISNKKSVPNSSFRYPNRNQTDRFIAVYNQYKKLLIASPIKSGATSTTTTPITKTSKTTSPATTTKPNTFLTSLLLFISFLTSNIFLLSLTSNLFFLISTTSLTTVSSSFKKVTAVSTTLLSSSSSSSLSLSLLLIMFKFVVRRV